MIYMVELLQRTFAAVEFDKQSAQEVRCSMLPCCSVVVVQVVVTVWVVIRVADCHWDVGSIQQYRGRSAYHGHPLSSLYRSKDLWPSCATAIVRVLHNTEKLVDLLTG
jgi:hypothetical protein